MGIEKQVTINSGELPFDIVIGRPRVIVSKCYRMSFNILIPAIGLYLNNLIVSSTKDGKRLFVLWPGIDNTNYKLFMFSDQEVRDEIDRHILDFYATCVGVGAVCADDQTGEEMIP